jgi:iron(III) transport system ATP-binding protein
LRCVGARLTPGAESAVSIRQHNIDIMPAEPAAGLENMLPATVTRHVFLGDSRDYMVTLADGTALRVVASADQSVAQGTKVWLHLPPPRCRALVG